MRETSCPHKEQCPLLRRQAGVATPSRGKQAGSHYLSCVWLQLCQSLSEPPLLASPSPTNKPLTLSLSLGLICCSVEGKPRGLVA